MGYYITPDREGRKELVGARWLKLRRFRGGVPSLTYSDIVDGGRTRKGCGGGTTQPWGN